MAPHAPPPPPESTITDRCVRATLTVGTIVLIVLLGLLYLYRFRLSKRKKKTPSATSFRVRGIVRPTTNDIFPSSTSVPPFSRDGMASIVMPEKTITRKPPPPYGLSDEAVVPSHTPSPASSTLDLHRTLQNAPRAEHRSGATSFYSPPEPQHNRSSSGFSAYAQYRFPPGLGSRLVSSNFVPPSWLARTVHQSFEPSLPDELALRCGEGVTVLRSFDDGWCVLVRDTSHPSRASLLRAEMKKSGDNVDIGLAPIWVFARPLKGVTSTRPFRSTSLGALRHTYSREEVMSWANFS